MRTNPTTVLRKRIWLWPWPQWEQCYKFRTASINHTSSVRPSIYFEITENWRWEPQTIIYIYIFVSLENSYIIDEQWSQRKGGTSSCWYGTDWTDCHSVTAAAGKESSPRTLYSTTFKDNKIRVGPTARQQNVTVVNNVTIETILLHVNNKYIRRRRVYE